MSARALPILMYHHVSPNPGLVTVSPDTFRRQMAWLADHGWRAVDCDALSSFLDGHPLPAKSVLITFDDGYLDNWVHAHPVLQEFGLSATIFLITGWIGDGPVRDASADTPNHKTCMAAVRTGEQARVMMNWEEVEAMRSAGTGQFHSHTHSHTRWDKLHPPGAARLDSLAEDLAASQRALTVRTGNASRHLCWPQGYYEPDYFAVAAAAGFDTLYTTEKRVVVPGGDRQRLGRVVVKDRADAWFARRLTLFSSPFWGGLYVRLRGA